MKRVVPFLLIVAGSVPLFGAPDYSSAIEQQRRRLEQGATAAAWNDLGALLLLEGDREAASGAFSAALDLDPNSFEALYNLGVLELDRDPNRSRKLLRSALNQTEDGWTHYRLAQAFDRLQRERAATAHYARAFELDRSLLDPAVNPEIVANRLTTRSLLRARNPSAGVRPSPRFVDPGALRDLLLDAQPATEPAELDEMPTDEPTPSAPVEEPGADQPAAEGSPDAGSDDSDSGAA